MPEIRVAKYDIPDVSTELDKRLFDCEPAKCFEKDIVHRFYTEMQKTHPMTLDFIEALTDSQMNICMSLLRTLHIPPDYLAQNLDALCMYRETVHRGFLLILMMIGEAHEAEKLKTLFGGDIHDT